MKPVKYINYTILAFGLMISCQEKKQPVEFASKNFDGEVIDFKVLPFEITDVKRLIEHFKYATELNRKYLFNYEPNRYCLSFVSSNMYYDN